MKRLVNIRSYPLLDTLARAARLRSSFASLLCLLLLCLLLLSGCEVPALPPPPPLPAAVTTATAQAQATADAAPTVEPTTDATGDAGASEAITVTDVTTATDASTETVVAEPLTETLTETDALTDAAAISTVEISTVTLTPVESVPLIETITDTESITDGAVLTAEDALTETVAPTETVASTDGESMATDAISESTTLTNATALSATESTTVAQSLTDTAVLTDAAALTERTELTASEGLTESAALTDAATSDDNANASDAATTLVRAATGGSRLNVRSGPGATFDVVGKVINGEAVILLDTSADGQWYQVAIDPDTQTNSADSGWVFAELAVLEEAAPSASGTLTQTESLTATQPLSAAQSITGAEAVAGTKTVTGTEAITETQAATSTPIVLPSVPVAVARPAQINVRGGPGTNYPVLAQVTGGTRLVILARNASGDWYQTRLDTVDEPVWVYAPLVDVSGPLEDLPRLSDEEIPPPPDDSGAATPGGADAAAQAEPASPDATGEVANANETSAEVASVEAASAAVAAAPPPAPPIVSAPPPSGGGFFGYGVQAHMLGGGIDPALNATNDLGFNWIKQQVEWRLFEGTPGALDFSELRRIVDGASGRGINVLFSVVNAPNWAREEGFDASVGGPPADPQSYATFVGRLAGDFCGSGLKAIEVWNEQNLHYEWGNQALDAAAYMNLLRPAYASIKSACPQMLVISGAPTPAGNASPYAVDDFAYLEAMYQNGLAQYADGIGIHASGYNVPPTVTWEDACTAVEAQTSIFRGACDTPHHSWSFRSTVEGYRNIMVVYGDAEKRLWPTEFGWAAGGAFNPNYMYADDNSFDEQAAWTVEAFEMMRQWGYIGPAFLWNLNFRVVADGTEKAQWGIVRNDWSPLPVYTALQGMAK